MECPTCVSEEIIFIGALGQLKWFLCQCCGIEFYTKGE